MRSGASSPGPNAICHTSPDPAGRRGVTRAACRCVTRAKTTPSAHPATEGDRGIYAFFYYLSKKIERSVTVTE